MYNELSRVLIAGPVSTLRITHKTLRGEYSGRSPPPSDHDRPVDLEA